MLTRRILSVLTMLLMLPWGAYAAIPPGSNLDPGAWVQAAHQVDLEPAGSMNARSIPPAEASIHRRCRIATLPGSPCSPDRALGFTEEEWALDDIPVANVPPSTGATAVRSLRRPPPLGPPRPV